MKEEADSGTMHDGPAVKIMLCLRGDVLLKDLHYCVLLLLVIVSITLYWFFPSSEGHLIEKNVNLHQTFHK